MCFFGPWSWHESAAVVFAFDDDALPHVSEAANVASVLIPPLAASLDPVVNVAIHVRGDEGLETLSCGFGAIPVSSHVTPPNVWRGMLPTRTERRYGVHHTA